MDINKLFFNENKPAIIIYKDYSFDYGYVWSVENNKLNFLPDSEKLRIAKEINDDELPEYYLKEIPFDKIGNIIYRETVIEIVDMINFVKEINSKKKL
jgi:hypothetical protein